MVFFDFFLPESPSKRLAGRTEGFSGADLRLLCESAAESALEDSLQRGTTRPIQPGDFDRALREVSPSTRPWFDVARNYAMFANEAGASSFSTLAAQYLNSGILPKGSSAALVSRLAAASA